LSLRRASTIEAIVNASVRCMMVAIVICSWIAISNHCALALAARGTGLQPVSDHRQDADATDCPFHSHPAKPAKQKDSTDQPCCKILRALAPSLIKNPAPAVADLVHADLSFAKLVVVPPPKISFNSVALDTGPPGKTSFAELIGSMRAHAPPADV
jgi:hypothetical protein